MSQLDSQTLIKVASLAKLRLDADVAQAYAGDIGKILQMMETLAHIDTEAVAPLANIHEVCQSLRPDVADAQIDRTLNQSMAPSVAEGLYLVPQVIE